MAWIGFVVIAGGILVPLSWTGFRGNTLWALVWPPAAAGRADQHTTPAGEGRRLQHYQKQTIAAVSAAWIITVIGGYALQWTWTGYAGNTLWDWLQLLLVPLVFPTILIPALIIRASSATRPGAPGRLARRPWPRLATAAGRTSP